jgi:hypothetical protein
MRRFSILLIIILHFIITNANSQTPDSIEVFLLTCYPGLSIETVYGHSAIRIINHNFQTDHVYSWGVYDFSAPHFAWKFAKGKLKYRIAGESVNSFLSEYSDEQRSVISQKINLNYEEKTRIIKLININLLPENKFYLYDFFYNNCATRIRDLIEQVIETDLVYAINNETKNQTYRELIDEAQKPLPWYTFGTDLLIGIPGDKIANLRDQMFLPEYLMKNLSTARINKNRNLVPLLQDPVTLLAFDKKDPKNPTLFQPFWIFTILFLIIIVLSIQFNTIHAMLWLDRFLFTVFSILSCLLIFFNFITDHDATKMNLNLIWLNPFLFLTLYALFTGKKMVLWFRIIAIISIGFIICLCFIPQSINLALIPIIMILVIRSISRSDLTLRNLNK